MENRRTKYYEGEYTNRNGKKYKNTIKLFPIIFTAGLAFTIIVNGPSGGTIIDEPKGPDGPIDTSNEDLELIEKIIAENPQILKQIVPGKYKIHGMDTLSGIAEKHGITLNRLLELNPELNRNTIIKPDQELRVETVTRYEGLDRDINLIESYFYDYVFNSSAGRIANGKKEVDHKEATLLIKSILGSKNDIELDKQTVYGKFVSTYIKYHSDETTSTVPEELKEEYYDELYSIYEEMMECNHILYLIDLKTYTVYIINGNTKSTEMEKPLTSIYN